MCQCLYSICQKSALQKASRAERRKLARQAAARTLRSKEVVRRTMISHQAITGSASVALARKSFQFGWRFAPACCAAQSVIRRGPGCTVPHHRVPWAAQNLHRSSGLHQENASASPMNAVHNSSSSSFSRPDGCGLTGRSTGHFAAGRVWASKA